MLRDSSSFLRSATNGEIASAVRCGWSSVVVRRDGEYYLLWLCNKGEAGAFPRPLSLAVELYTEPSRTEDNKDGNFGDCDLNLYRHLPCAIYSVRNTVEYIVCNQYNLVEAANLAQNDEQYFSTGTGSA
jgi:hypothetical protein